MRGGCAARSRCKRVLAACTMFTLLCGKPCAYSFCSTRGGAPREVSLRVECNPDAEGSSNALAFLSIHEPPDTCLYTVVLGSHLACSHPRLARSRVLSAQSSPKDVHCYVASARDARL